MFHPSRPADNSVREQPRFRQLLVESLSLSVVLDRKFAAVPF